jgi:hypothetical protein
MSRPFIAQHRGRCAAGCGEPIREGDWAEYVGGELMHEDCADDGPSDAAASRYLGRLAVPCPRCHLMHAGEC